MKIGFACGIFDLFHAGHVLMLQECKANCDYLIVGLNSALDIDYNINPGKSEPIYSLENRKIILESCKYVDEVIVYNNETELKEIMINKKIEIRFLGEDYRGKQITGEDLVREIYFINRGHGMSTSGFKKQIMNLWRK
jgi:glycerol-3-phosphate cytidylyltransferase